MNRLTKSILLILIILLYVSCGSPCSNNIIYEKESPDKSYKIIHFIRNCGASTDVSAHFSIVKITASLTNEAGNIFIFDSKHSGNKYFHLIKPVWKDNNSIEIKYSKKGRVFKREKRYNQITITYVEI